MVELNGGVVGAAEHFLLRSRHLRVGMTGRQTKETSCTVNTLLMYGLDAVKDYLLPFSKLG